MKKILLLAATALALSACSNDNDDNYIDEPVAAHISACIGQSAISRADGVEWAPGDAIGVTMSGRYFNIKYTTAGGDGLFSGTTMYFLNKREPVNMTAYYPYAGSEDAPAATIEATTDAEAQTASGRPSIDFMFDSKSGVTGLDPNINFEFAHKMSMLTLVFKLPSGMQNLSLKSYKISGLVLKGSFDPKTGVCSAADDVDAQELTIELDGETDIDKLPSLILFPQTALSITLDIDGTLNGNAKHYSCQLNFKDNQIGAGNNYEFIINVKSSGLTVSSCTIKDWNAITHDQVEAR